MNWIWLNENAYPQFQKGLYNVTGVPPEMWKTVNYCVAEFRKSFTYSKKIKSVKVKISADCFYHFYLNGEMNKIGPASAGGDFLCERPAPKHYADSFELDCNSDSADILVRVKLLPEVLTEYSKCHGGLAAELEFVFEDGTTEKDETDEAWLCRPDTSYVKNAEFNSSVSQEPWANAAETEDIWHAEQSYIPSLSLNNVMTADISINPEEEKSLQYELDKIYGVYLKLKADGKCFIEATTQECDGQPEMTENIRFGRVEEYFSFRQYSCSKLKLKIKSDDEKPVNIHVELIAPWYPFVREGVFKTSDEGFNKVYETCKHTLKICRQSIHLDSTKHQELLACTGDYNIESLMTLFCFDDFRLAEFDLMRTADWLVENNGRMFHTTYSLIWVQMLRDVYMMSGNIEVIKYCERAMEALFNRFESYMGDDGVIENPPDFMFVDWTVIDGYNMHHPPKALGQTVLNAFYYRALKCAEDIYNFIGNDEKAKLFNKKAETFKEAVNNTFFDKDKKLFFDGKGGKFGGGDWTIPENTDKRYYSKYPNILACAYGLKNGDEARDIIRRIIFDDTMQDIQPYFMHYMLQAVRRLDLFGEYGMKLLERWKGVVEACDKGLAEGWIAPDPSYSFDHSHAWGGTPAYNMPLAITGLEILEPGMKKIKLNPNLWGLDYAFVKIPSILGDITVELKKDEPPVITAPDTIIIV